MAFFELSQTGSAVLTLTVVVIMFIMFLRETFPTEVVAITGAALMLGLGLLPYEDALSVLSNPAPWTIAAMFIIMGALVRTGALEAFTGQADRLAKTSPALAIALLESRGFSATDFRTFHPGGSLGASLTHVSEIMHKGNDIPIAKIDTPMEEAVDIISKKRFGCVAIVDDGGDLKGIITDGDLRRNLNKALIGLKAKDIMTDNPSTIAPDALASTAMAELNARSITSLLVCEAGKPVGLIHLHDLLKIGVA